MNKWNEHNLETTSLSCYYVAKNNTVMNRISGECSTNVKSLMLGMLVQANEAQSDGTLRIRIFDTKNNDSDWNKTEWRCSKFDLICVPSMVWHYLIAVPVPQDRVNIANDSVFCQEANSMKIDHKVWYKPPNSSIKYRAVIKTIELVEEFGPGFYFGLELLEKPEGFKVSMIARRLCGVNGVVTTLKHVSPRKTDDTEFFNKGLINKRDIDESLSRQLDVFSNLTSKNNPNDLIINVSSAIADDSNNNNLKNKEKIEQFNEALVPKIVHQSTKSKIITNDSLNLSKIKFDHLPEGEYILFDSKEREIV